MSIIDHSLNVSKNITFFYTGGSIQMDAIEPIATEAERRDYDVSFTTDHTDSADIGIYCHHTHHIEAVNADLSFIMTHGVDQMDRPNAWLSEPWDRFDIGLLPGTYFTDLWRSQSWHPKTRPNIGVYPIGWPKSDHVFEDEFWETVRSHAQRLSIDSGRTVIYAPTTENHGKMTEFIETVSDVVDHLLIKHPPWKETQEFLVENKREIYEKHRGEEDVHILDEDTDIMECLAMADVLVSDESSVLLEAPLVETIPLSVTDWPVKFRVDFTNHYPGPQVPDLALRTEIDQLAPEISRIYDNFEGINSDILDQRSPYYSNLGESSAAVLDLIDGLVDDGQLVDEPVPTKHNLALYTYYRTRLGISHRIPVGIREKLRGTKIDALKDSIDERLGMITGRK